MMTKYLMIISLFLIATAGLTQSVVINEAMSGNINTLSDEDGKFPDWLELYNTSTVAVILDRYTLSDDASNPGKWHLPKLILQPGEFFLVYASGKDRNEFRPWGTMVSQGEAWRYRLGDSEPHADWTNLSFDDTDWPSGASGFGFGDDDDATELPQTISFYIRKTFEIPDVSQVHGVRLFLDYDDGFIAYINGEEVARDNLGSPGDFVPYDELADGDKEAAMYRDRLPSEFDLAKSVSLLQTGENVMAIQVHNATETSNDLTWWQRRAYRDVPNDLSCIPFLLFEFNDPEFTFGAPLPEWLKSEVVTFLHTNFKLNSNGETLSLYDADENLVSALELPELESGFSFGRGSGGSEEFYIFTQPTPGTPNSQTDRFKNYLEAPHFSMPGGFYTSPVILELSSNSEIYYTTDGSEPTELATKYVHPIPITGTQVVRAKTISKGVPSKGTITQTFFVNENSTLPVVSLATDPANLWSTDQGIYHADHVFEDWERPVHIEYYEPTGALGFSQDGGVKMYGGWARLMPQKSLAIFARDKYGQNRINYRFFADKDIDEFKSIIFRNSGNDWSQTLFRDGMMQTLLSGQMDVDYQGYRPAVLFLNGEYWGIHNIREKINKYYPQSNYGYDPDHIDLIESEPGQARIVITGDDVHYDALVNYLESSDVSVSENYAYVETQMDMDEFINYQIGQIYIANTDWPGNNVKFWRPKTIDGKWRWMIYDTDFGFNLEFSLIPSPHTRNTLEMASASNGPKWANPPWSTFLFRKLCENQEFTDLFIQRFASHLNTTFQPHRIIAIIDSLKTNMEAEMPKHIERWSDFPAPYYGDMFSNMAQWDDQIERMRIFAANRTLFVWEHIKETFNLEGFIDVSIDASPGFGGKINISSIDVSTFPWRGQYFKSVPIQLEAKPNLGFRFVGWSDNTYGSENPIQVLSAESVSLTATFERMAGVEPTLVFNEINYHPADDFDTQDWVELYNNSQAAFDISGWQFRDSNDEHVFTIPEKAVLAADAYLVLCENATAFQTLFPKVENFMGDFNFGLANGGETLRLFDDQDNLVDSVAYDDGAPWPTEPDGSGSTLELIELNLDNNLAESWRNSISNHGSPGQGNGIFTLVSRPDSEIIPSRFALEQNYPNPFNPTTEFRFHLPRAGNVKFEIFNGLGQRMATVMDKPVSAGIHTITWHPQPELASGIYYYQMRVDNIFSQAKSMLLLQ